MITNTLFEIPITNRNVSAFKNLGYQVKSGSSHLIKLEDCPGKIAVTCKCDKCGIYYTVTKGRLNETNSKFCKEHRWEVYSETRKEYWNSDEGIKIRKAKGPKISKNRTGKGLKSKEHWIDKKKYHKYCMDVKRHQYKYRNEISKMKNFTKIGKCGVKGAYQLDHIISKKFGYDNKIPAEHIGHICNLQIIPWEENLSKSDGCGMSLKTLINMIESKQPNGKLS